MRLKGKYNFIVNERKMMKYVLVLVLCSIVNISVYAKIKTESGYPINLDNNYINLSLSKLTGSSYYNADGTLKPTIKKPLTLQHDSLFTFDRESYIFRLDISQMYQIDTVHEIGGEIGISYSSHALEQKYASIVDSIENIVQTYESNLFEYLDLAVKYRGKFGKFIVDAKAKYSIALSSNDTILEEDIINKSNVKLVTGGYSVLSPGFDIYYIGEKAFFSLSASYSFISGEKSDMYSFGAGVGLLSVENAVLQANIEYNKSTQAIDNKHQYLPTRYQYQEEFLKLGAGFKIKFMDDLSAGIKYDVLLFGKNILNSNIINAYVTYNVDFFNTKKIKK